MAVETTVSKPAIKSSQNWANVGAVAAIGILGKTVPAVGDFLSAHPKLVVGAMGIMNILWRTFITKKPIEGIITQK